MTQTTCHERSDLLRRIKEASTTLHQLTTEAVAHARRPQGSLDLAAPSNFQDLQRSHDLGMIRVQTLRECLDLHIDAHGCKQ